MALPKKLGYVVEYIDNEQNIQKSGGIIYYFRLNLHIGNWATQVHNYVFLIFLINKR